jgi:hypothetical protein
MYRKAGDMGWAWVCVVLIAVVVAPSWAQSGSTSGSTDAGTSTAEPADTVVARWGPIWYIRGRTVYDDVTMVAGGAEGSAILLIQFDDDGRPQPEDVTRNDTSLWILVEGDYLYLRPMPGLPATFITGQPGQGTTSRRYGVFTGTPTEIDKFKMSELLRGVYARTELNPQPILHVPFLIGKGWPGYNVKMGQATVTKAAAGIDAAKRLLADMDLKVQVVGGQTADYYVVAQNPAPGTRLARGATVQLTTEAGMVMRKIVASPPGDTANAPNVISAAANGDVQTAEINSQYSDALSGAGCATTRRDVFWQLPAEVRGKQVTVSQTVGATAAVVVSIWNRDEKDGAPHPSAPLEPVACAGSPDCCATWPGADLSYVGSSTGFDYIVVEGQLADTAHVEFRVEWTTAD